MARVSLGKRVVGAGEAPYIIAEVGANHNGNMDLCRKLIDAAVACKADAVKFQSWSSSSLSSRTGYKGPLKESDVQQYELSPQNQREAAEYCAKKDITFCSTPFSRAEVDLLFELGAPFFKIASMDLNNHPFLRYVAAKGRPIVLSTGMGTLGEITAALEVIRSTGNDQVVALHCVALYPPQYAQLNLRNIPMLADVLGIPVGFSDHSLGPSCSLAAIALGACVIEKHFTIDKKMEGWDHAISADVADMTMLVQEGRHIHEALGTRERRVTSEEREKARYMRRSLVLVKAKRAGDVLREEDVDFKRPGTGIRPDELSYALGRKLARDLPADETIEWSDLT
jgi:N-acetylneuraminate synthase